MKMRILFVGLLLACFTTTAAAQKNWVEDFLNRYRVPKIDPAATVTPQVSDAPWRPMVQSGALPISINDVVRLMLASNLDVTVNRFAPLSSEYFIQTLFRPFEPTLTLSGAMNRSSQPTTSQLIGSAAFTSLTHRYSAAYGQTLQTGTRYDVDLIVNRNSSNNRFNTFNPSYFSTIVYSLNQPLLRNLGRDINTRSIRIARNNVHQSEIQFELQMIDLVTQAQSLYWDLVLQREDIKVRQQALQLAEKTLSDNKRQVQIGTMAPIEVVQAESAVAQRQEQMITTTYNADSIQDRIKRMITNLGDPAMLLAQLTPIEAPRKPSADDIMPLEEAVKYALESRPELKQLALQLQNSDIDLQYTRNQLKPDLTVGGSYTQNGVGGVERATSALGVPGDVVKRGGLTDAFGQLFGYNFTGYSVGFSLQIPLSNKTARAEYSRAVIDKQTIEARRNALTQAIALQVRNAHTQVEMNRARITAAQKALQLAQMQLEAEQKKFQLGTSQIRFVLQEQQNLTFAQTTEIQALVNYTKALVDYDQAVGRTLRKNNIEIDKQLRAAVSDSGTAGPMAGQR